MPRYEFSEGSSNKFWEIELTSNKLGYTTKFGKIGSAGQTKIKEFSSAALAKADFDKIVAEKVKKGYALQKTGKAGKTGKTGKAKPDAATGGTLDARNPELEAAIVANPFDEDAWQIFADFLIEQGDPRGELASLQINKKYKQADKYIADHVDYLLGEFLAGEQKVHDENYNNSRSHLRDKDEEKRWKAEAHQAFIWRHGFIDRVRLSHDEYSVETAFDGQLSKILEAVLEHPSGRFVREFQFQSNGDPNEDNLEDLIAVLGKHAPATTRKITLGDNVDQISWHHTGSLAKLWKGVPELRVLEIETGEFDVGKMVAPKLERAVFVTGGLDKKCARNIATADMPNIAHLEIYFGTENYGGNCSLPDLKALLDRTDLKHLRYLGLENSEFQNDIARVIGSSKIVKHLTTLDLSKGAMTDEGALALAAAKDQLKHLECLDLSDNYLTKVGLAAVKGICKKVVVDDQREPYEYNGELSYFVSITE